MAALARVQQIELDAVQTTALDVFRAHVGGLGDTVAHDARRRGLGHLGHPRVVGVEHGDPIGWQLFDELLLRLLYAFDGTDPPEVDGQHRGHDPIRGRARRARKRMSPT